LVEFIQGGVYTITITEEGNSNSSTKVKIFKLTNENTVNILWQFPQHFLLAVGEILLAITGLDFSYSQVK
jgi:solute carrier family 15 oligopeptide transporter 1